MAKKLYVGNLSFEVDNAALEAIFSEHGRVEDVRIITDRYSGQSRGFGFVEMSTEEEARAAMDALDGKDLQGRSLKVNEAKPREDRSGDGR